MLGSLKRPTSHEAAMNSGSLSPFLSAWLNSASPKNVHSFSGWQPKDERSCWAAVSTMVSSLASGPMKAPEKQAETMTTRLRILAWLSMEARCAGRRPPNMRLCSRSAALPSGAPWEVRKMTTRSSLGSISEPTWPIAAEMLLAVAAG